MNSRIEATTLISGGDLMVEYLVREKVPYRPVSTGGWELPPLPPAQPNFEKLALGK